MNASIYVVRIAGKGVDVLTLHASEEGAGEAMLRAGGDVWEQRFGYRPASDATPLLVRDALQSEGYVAEVGLRPVEL